MRAQIGEPGEIFQLGSGKGYICTELHLVPFNQNLIKMKKMESLTGDERTDDEGPCMLCKGIETNEEPGRIIYKLVI